MVTKETRSFVLPVSGRRSDRIILTFDVERRNRIKAQRNPELDGGYYSSVLLSVFGDVIWLYCTSLRNQSYCYERNRPSTRADQPEWVVIDLLLSLNGTSRYFRYTNTRVTVSRSLSLLILDALTANIMSCVTGNMSCMLKPLDLSYEAFFKILVQPRNIKVVEATTFGGTAGCLTRILTCTKSVFVRKGEQGRFIGYAG